MRVAESGVFGMPSAISFHVLPKSVGLVDPRIAVVHLMAVDGEVRRAGVVARRLDVADVPHGGSPGCSRVTFVQLLPPSRVTCTRPSLVPAQISLCSMRRLGDREHDAGVLDADVVGREAARDLLAASCRCASDRG